MILPEWTITDLRQKLDSGELSARQLAELYLGRIEAIDKNGPHINSIIELNPDALEIAGKLDAERKKKKARGALHGIPILLKDNIDTHDKMQTTAGSLALEGNYAAQDAFIVQRLRKAGAVVLGKTNLSEWANFRGKRSVSGWSSRGGLTRNPYALDRSACGSSSGSGAAITANLSVGAVGTETDGSIICPAQTNGIVGIKPTLGLLSRSGIIPVAHSQDTPGPMTRTVADAAILLGAMTGVDAGDSATRPSKKRGLSNYAKFLELDGLKGARIGVARNMAGTNPRVMKIFETCLDAMRHLGAVIVDPADVKHFDKFSDSEIEVLHYEFKADLNAYLKSLDASVRVHSMEDVVKFNEENNDQTMPYFGQEHMTMALERGSLKTRKYKSALAKNLRLARKQGIDATMKKYKLDAIVVPSGGPAWVIDLANGDAINWDMESTSPAAVAGYPHITVPAGYVFGLPVGISFFSTAWQEPTLIRLAYAFEQATQFRRQPRFLPTANLNP
ncbi:MAG TPA: amidase [Anaerolineales bacterium]|nr:amidase [Anaerolineales bacterium]HNQ93765.1 amidase [Anaerolineales bacterium]HNS60516.1 amidase [Anaerolineales bacterium]